MQALKRSVSSFTFRSISLFRMHSGYYQQNGSVSNILSFWTEMKSMRYYITANLICRWWHCEHVVVHIGQVHRGRVGTVEETCDWALTVTSLSLWTTSSQHGCRLFPLRWRPPASTVDREVQSTWRLNCPTGRCSSRGWYLCVTGARRSLEKYHIESMRYMRHMTTCMHNTNTGLRITSLTQVLKITTAILVCHTAVDVSVQWLFTDLYSRLQPVSDRCAVVRCVSRRRGNNGRQMHWFYKYCSLKHS